MRHNCGGMLVEARIFWFTRLDATVYTELPGYRCNACGVELVAAKDIPPPWSDAMSDA